AFRRIIGPERGRKQHGGGGGGQKSTAMHGGILKDCRQAAWNNSGETTLSRFGSRGNCVQKKLFQLSIDITDQGRGRRRLTSDFLGKLPLFLRVLNALRHQRRNHRSWE